MKKTAPYTIEYITEYGMKCFSLSDEKITCEVVGEMINGAKVWQDNQWNQYYLIRQQGKYAFTKI